MDYKEKYINKDDVPNQDRRPGIWAERMERLRAGEAVVLYPRDSKHYDSLQSTAHMAAAAKGVKIKTHREARDETLELYIWLA